jgi:hypothetical protein
MIKTAGDITGSSVNIAEAVYATISSKWTTEFRINVDGTLIPKDGLVAYYPFNGNANDESGNNNNGTVYGGATLTTDRNGNANKAYSFDGVDDYIKVNNSTPISNMNEVTMSIWFNVNKWYTNSAGSYFNLLTKSEIGNKTKRGLGLQLTSSSIIAFINGKSKTQNFNFNTSQWYNLCVSYSNNVFKYYINGKLIGQLSGLDISNYSDNLPLLFGVDPEGLYEISNGKLDNIRIYNRVLTDSEINAIFIND